MLSSESRPTHVSPTKANVLGRARAPRRAGRADTGRADTGRAERRSLAPTTDDVVARLGSLCRAATTGTRAWWSLMLLGSLLRLCRTVGPEGHADAERAVRAAWMALGTYYEDAGLTGDEIDDLTQRPERAAAERGLRHPMS